MVIYQAFNKKIGSWVKYKFSKGKGFDPFDVKQKEPFKPFKGIKKKGQKRYD